MSALIKRNQVDGLVAMKALLDQIDASYPASKVTTTVIQTPETTEGAGDQVYYTGQALLAELKNTVDGMLGGGSGLSLPELKRLIDKLNAELNGGEYHDPEANNGEGDDVELLGFKNKVINDVVRVEFTWNGTAATPVNAAKITEELTAGQNLSAYTADGSPIVSSSGTAVTFNFDTKAFSAAPYILDVDATKISGGIDSTTGQPIASQAVYTPFTGTFKVFPIGTWTLETLPADALLDNNEMQLIAYDQALQKVIIQLATDKNLIDRITEAVGETAIQDAVKAASAVIDARVDRLEGVDDADLSKVAVKVDRIVGTPAVGNQGETGYVAAETVTKTTQIASKAYIDAVDDAIKADIGLANAATNFDSNGKVAASTVRGEINSIKARLIYNDALIQNVKAKVIESIEGTDTKVTDDENTISETALVTKFAAVDSAAATLKQNFETFRDTTAPATYVTISKVTDTFTKITAVNDEYTDSYTDSTHPEVIGKKIFNEQISEIKDTIDNLDSVSYKFANIVLAPAVAADATTGITEKNAEAGPVAEDTPVLSAQYTRNLITNEQERAAKAEADLDAKTYDWNNIVIDDGAAINVTTNVTTFNAVTGATSSSNVSNVALAARTAEVKSETTEVPSVDLLNAKLAETDAAWRNQLTADKTEIINRIAYENQIGSEALTREIARLTATAGDTLVTPADGSGAVTADADGVIKQLDDKTADWANIVTSAGIAAQIKDNDTVLQDVVAAEATHSASTQFTSKQYVDDAVKVAAANAKKDIRVANRAMDARVDELEAVTSVTESLAVTATTENDVTVETFTLSQTPIVTNEIVVYVNGIAYFLTNGVYSIADKVITWNSTAAGFTLSEVLDAGDSVVVKYQYRNTTLITPIA